MLRMHKIYVQQSDIGATYTWLTIGNQRHEV